MKKNKQESSYIDVHVYGTCAYLNAHQVEHRPVKSYEMCITQAERRTRAQGLIRWQLLITEMCFPLQGIGVYLHGTRDLKRELT